MGKPSHKQTPLPCSKCDRDFSRKPDLDRHMREVHELQKFPCTYQNCPYTASRPERTRRHRERNHPDYIESKYPMPQQNNQVDMSTAAQTQGPPGNANYQVSMPEYHSSYATDPNQTFTVGTVGWNNAAESINPYTTSIAQHQQTSFPSPDPSMQSNYQSSSSDASYNNDWSYGEVAPQEGYQPWDNTTVWQNGH
ncbi:hypothetical protein HYALB_00013063 [Hymenoscyphus albidus]|uniref:C2H2-type domain-containing protein n=1 Tax=Hymenoscyphus albidus TaxID=595503 RepID=A0A9N9LVT8_9HELO|nr:hypothetical protein HYALB_00013063 [Hymenoscyphus albidus]